MKYVNVTSNINGANLKATVDTERAVVEPKLFQQRTRDAREHFAAGITLQYTTYITDKAIQLKINKYTIHKHT